MQLAEIPVKQSNILHFNSDAEIVPGVLLFKNSISENEQSQLIELYKSIRYEMYEPFEAGQFLTCLGFHWNPRTNSYNRRRDFDQSVAKYIPFYLKEIVRRFEKLEPNFCEINYFKPATNTSICKKTVLNNSIISISLGSPWVFRIEGEENNFLDIEIENGDVLILSPEGQSRQQGMPLIKKIEHPPFYSILRGGKLNFIFKTICREGENK